MAHVATAAFWEAFDQLPKTLQVLARKNFELLKENPDHPSLHFKRVGDYWSVRVGRSYRALGIDSEKGIAWFWIGTHDRYIDLIDS